MVIYFEWMGSNKNPRSPKLDESAKDMKTVSPNLSTKSAFDVAGRKSQVRSQPDIQTQLVASTLVVHWVGQLDSSPHLSGTVKSTLV